MRNGAAIWVCLGLLSSLVWAKAQTGRSLSPADELAPGVEQAGITEHAGLPRLIRFGGTLKDGAGAPLSGPVDVTFSLFKQEDDADPIWWETQTVEADHEGRYSVLLGSTQQGGLPTDLFVSGDARWIEVQAGGIPQGPRILLVSVPYALKAGDADTLGGLPASAFLAVQPPLQEPPSLPPYTARSPTGSNSEGSGHSQPIARPANFSEPCTYTSTGAVNCIATGTNQNITLTPSGRGAISLLSSSPSPAASLAAQTGSGPGSYLYVGPAKSSFNSWTQGFSGLSSTLVNSFTSLNTGGANLPTALQATAEDNSLHEVMALYGAAIDTHTGGTRGETGLQGVRGDAYTAPAMSAPTNLMAGVSSYSQHNGSGTVTNQAGFYAWGNDGSGSSTNSYGFYSADQAKSGANQYGFYAAQNSRTNSWAFYAGGTAQSYFGGNVGIGTSSPQVALDINSDRLRIENAHTPASSSESCYAGTIVWDANYVYVCTATNTWKRAALSSF